MWRLAVASAILLLTSTVADSTFLLAQDASPIGRGSLIVDGTASIGRSEASTACDSTGTCLGGVPANWSVHVSPGIQYFLVKGLALGAQASLAWNWYEDSQGPSSFGTSIGPVVSYYQSIGSKRVFPFARAAASSYHSRSKGFGLVGTSHGTTMDFSAGALLLIVRNLGLEGALHYRTQRMTYQGLRVRSNSLTLDFGLAAFVY